MKNFLPASLALVIMLSLLSSCRFSNDVSTPKNAEQTHNSTDATSNEEIYNLIKTEQLKPEKSAEFTIELNQIDALTTTATIYILNPEQKAIQSAEAWLTYNPANISAQKIETDTSLFNMAAPNENNIEPAFGLIKIGRSHSEAPITESRIELATITFSKDESQKDLDAFIDFYDYQEDGGHIQINTLLEGTVYNIAKAPRSPATIIR